ncbi:MAG TPA: carboxypeptidase-like regulatory domain-containing protein [Vicinamibacterales bacterium]|nr:carboxypeptidase-like regulatory domain-containing protein [Vicinamibacterales bacterium]
MQLRVMAAALTVALGLACHPGPIVDTGPKPPATGGTISGIVRASGSNAPLSGRKVTVTDIATGRQYEVSTATNGGYTIKVPEGTYRLEVELRSNETLASRPEQTRVNQGDLDAERNFAISVNAQP